MLPFLFKVILLIAIAFAYAAFDLFNKRNVPDIFVYSSVVVAFLVTLTYPLSTIEISIPIALIIGSIGYILYKKGILGAGDFFEFMAISMIFPLQPNPIITGVNYFATPFILSVFIATGYASAIAIPVYYLVILRRRKKVAMRIDRRRFLLGITLFASYLMMLLLIDEIIGLSWIGMLLILLIAIPSSLIVLFEKQITTMMISYVYPSELENEDMIATNMMEKKDIEFFTKKTELFGRLATPELIKNIKNVKRRIPVYKNAVPFAALTFVGVVIALLFANIILLILY